jgi:transposase-like protein
MPISRKQALQLYTDGDLPVDEIAEQAGVSRATLYNWLSNAGLSRQRRPGRNAGLAAQVDRLADHLASIQMSLSDGAVDARWGDARDRLNRIEHNQDGFREEFRVGFADLHALRAEHATLRQAVSDLSGAVNRLAGMIEGRRPGDNGFELSQTSHEQTANGPDQKADD